MTSKESYWAEFDRKCDAWIAKNMDSELMSVLRNLQELEPDRGSENLHFFRTVLLTYCYTCCAFDTIFDGKFNKESREKDSEFYEQAPRLIKNINELLSFAEKWPEFHKVLHEDKDVNFEGILTKYRNQVALAVILKDMKKSLPHWKQHGNLYYPNDIKDQAKRRVPQANSLLFGLVFYLRRYTDQDTPDSEWMQRVEGPMPTNGRPHYELVAKIANAVNELCTPPIFDNKLSDEQVRKRINTLVDNNVELSLSTGLRYSQLRKNIKKSH